MTHIHTPNTEIQRFPPWSESVGLGGMWGFVVQKQYVELAVITWKSHSPHCRRGGRGSVTVTVLQSVLRRAGNQTRSTKLQYWQTTELTANQSVRLCFTRSRHGSLTLFVGRPVLNGNRHIQNSNGATSRFPSYSLSTNDLGNDLISWRK